MYRDRMKRKGVFALSQTAEIILVVVGLILLIFFAYYLRDKIGDLVKKIIEFLTI